jgi:hypothetical protein
MNQEYYFFRCESFFGGPTDVSWQEYQPVRQNFLEYWSSQMRSSKVTFKYKPLGSNPFQDVLFSSKGRYDIANHFNGFGPNFLFVSDRMLDIFEEVKVPEYELYPIKYRQRSNIYNGHFLAFLQDFTNFVDFQNSKICYKPYGYKHYIPVEFQSGEDFSMFIRENASIHHENGSTNLGGFRYPEIRFQDFVYEMDLLCIPFLITDFLMSEKLKNVLKREKNVKINYMDWEDTYFRDGVLILHAINGGC